MDQKYQKIAFTILTIVTIGGLSVSGIMQSTERVTTTGIVVVTEPEPVFIPPRNNQIIIAAPGYIKADGR